MFSIVYIVHIHTIYMTTQGSDETALMRRIIQVLLIAYAVYTKISGAGSPSYFQHITTMQTQF